MGQFYENFNGATVGSAHPDLTLEFGQASQAVVAGNPLAESDASVEITWVSGTFLRSAFSWAAVQTSGATTVKFLATFDNHTASDPGQIVGPILSGAGSDATYTGYAIWYGENYRLARYSAGSDSTVASAAGLSTPGATTRYVEIYRNGDLIEGRSWDVSGSRPATANVSYTDPTPLTVAGFSGISALLTSSASISQQLQIHEIEAATDGDPLPGGPVAPTGPTITDVDTDESVYPGQSFIITGSNFGATQGTGGVTIGSVAQTVTAWGDTSITCTAVRGGNNYGAGKTLTATTDAATTATSTVAQEAEPGTFAVTAANPNTTDDASLWTGLIDTATTNPITIVDGDQAWVKNPNNLTNLAVAPDGTITADTEGDFVVQIWIASEGVWGGDQTVTFAAPDTTASTVTSVGVSAAGTYAIGDTLSFTPNWDEAVNVTGTPAINFTIGGSARQANYASGSGTAATAFGYTVQSGDEGAVSVTSLTLDGGTIKDAAGNNAVLTLNAVGDTSGITVDGIRPVVSVNSLTTTDTDPIITGSSGDATSLTLVVTGIGTYNPVPSGGAWSQQLPLSALGDYPMTLNGTDANGNAAVEAAGVLSVVDEIVTQGRGLFRPLFIPTGKALFGKLFR